MHRKKKTCSLWKKKNFVRGTGAKKPLICLVGEAPGKEEVLQKKPFVGRAGKILNTLLVKAKIVRKDLYITNLIKCPIFKRKFPSSKEIEKWKSLLASEMHNLQPRIILSLGNHASKALFSLFALPFTSMKALHGKTFRISSLWGDLLLIPLYHPSAAGRNRKLFSTSQKDLKKIKKILHSLHSKVEHV